MLGCMVGPNPGGLARTAAGKTPGPGSVLHRGACMEFQDKVLKCVDCGTEFVFTAGEQLFFYDKQFKNEPKHALSVIAARRTSVYPELGYPISRFWITRPQTFEASGVC